MNPAFRYGFLPVSIGILLLSLIAAPGCCKRGVGTTERAGVTVTKEVPHSKETVPELTERERANPLPARGDTAIHSHKIHRTGNDNGVSNPLGENSTEK